MYVNSSDPVLRKRYKSQFDAGQTQLSKELKRAKVDHLCFCASDEVSRILREFFQKRKRMRYL
jgi:hypothetical protein